MKHNILLPIALIYFFLFSTKCFGQFEINDEDTNFFSVVNKYYSNSTTWSDSAEGGSLSEFKRWENFWLKRIDADGNLNNYVRASHQIVNKRYFHNSLSAPQTPSGVDNWRPLGPFGLPSTSRTDRSTGNGQMNRLCFDPADQHTLYASSGVLGGLWKGIEGNNTFNWTPQSDDVVPNLGCGDISIYYKNGNQYRFISLGTSKKFYPQLGFGIYRSVNGQRFRPYNVGLLSSASPYLTIPRILVSPYNPDILYAATSQGLFRTTDATTSCTWNNVLTRVTPNEQFRGIAFHPTNPMIVYTSGKDIYQSIDGGNTWGSILTNSSFYSMLLLPNEQITCININTTSQASFQDELFANVVTEILVNNQVTSTKQRIIKFNGTSWVALGVITNGNGAYYDRIAIEVSPTDHNIIFASGDQISRSNFSSGNFIWTVIGSYNGDLHADVHDLKLDATGRLFAACDGGIYICDDPYIADPVFRDISDGLQVGTIYGMGASPTDENVIIVGEQDCGDNFTLTANQSQINWIRTIPNSSPYWEGDGAQCLIDNINPSIMYGNSLYERNKFMKTTDAFQNISVVPAYGGSWTGSTGITNYFHHEIGYHDNNLYSVINNIGSYYNGNWHRKSIFESDFSSTFCHGDIRLFGITFAPSNENYLYAAAYQLPDVNVGCVNLISKIFKSTTAGGENRLSTCFDGSVGTCWIDITPPSLITPVVDLAVSFRNEDHLYACCSGYTNAQKVFESQDGGMTWNNITTNFPNVSANCIVYEYGSDDQIYVGTDQGVYYTNRKLMQNNTGWLPYFDNVFPYCSVQDLIINYKINRIRAATYGRGVWESPLACPLDLNLSLSNTVNTSKFEEAEINITSDEIILSGDVKYRAGLSIDLNTGFEVTASTNSAFIGFIHGCNSSGNSFRIKNNSNQIQSDLESDTNEQLFVFGPNPTNSVCRIYSKSETPMNKIILYDLLGNIVFESSNIVDFKYEFEVSNINPGIYLMNVKNSEQLFIVKLVIQ